MAATEAAWQQQRRRKLRVTTEQSSIWWLSSGLVGPIWLVFTVYTATADGAVAGVVWLGELPLEAVSDKVFFGAYRRDALVARQFPGIQRRLAKVGVRGCLTNGVCYTLWASTFLHWC